MMVWSSIKYARSLEHSVRPVQSNWGTGRAATWTLVGLLCILQCILAVWLVMIFKVAWKVVTGAPANDDRSDIESEVESEDESEVVAAAKSSLDSKSTSIGLSQQHNSNSTADKISRVNKRLKESQR
jgi:beta-lactamase regulating signal transducer with metallopeptidase domain